MSAIVLVKLSNGNNPDHPTYDTPLLRFIFQSLSKKRELFFRFDEFMQLALYHPKHGYYTDSEKHQLGREGDFYTSVSVGETFGMLLGYAIEKKWSELCREHDQPLVLVEQGAHDGQLARDILDGLSEQNSPLLNQISYRIIDPHGSVMLTEDLGG